MAESVQLLGVICIILSAALADNVPVLIWSSDRPMSDLPQAPTSGSVSQEAFHSNYLTPLLDKTAPVIVAFLQDKLHINDISKYADVYNPDSDGGAFRNIKGHLDEHFSLELPQVEGSHLALDALRQDFPGTVHDLSPTSDLSDLDLQVKGFSLVIVRLQPVADAQNEEAAIAANDELIGKVSRHLEKRSVKYTALYTAEMSHSQQRERRESHHSRRLLEAPDMDGRGAFYNVSYTNGTVYAYLTSVSACIRYHPDPDKLPAAACHVNFTVQNLTHSDMTVTKDSNGTVRITLMIQNIQTTNKSNVFNFSMTIPIKNDKDRWEILDSEVSIWDGTNETDVVKNFKLVTHGYDSIIPLLYSFHCSSMEWYPKNMSDTELAYIVLGGFQVQAFYLPGTGFSLSQDCMGWFSTAIWMGLFPVAIHLLILFFGMYMLASLTTNDRFDDPKSKALTINAGE